MAIIVEKSKKCLGTFVYHHHSFLYVFLSVRNTTYEVFRFFIYIVRRAFLHRMFLRWIPWYMGLVDRTYNINGRYGPIG